jgi:UDP-N-acetylglucosamine 4,6-dehydratase (inverting)
MITRKKNTINNKIILVTGGTGSFGNEFVERTLQNFKPKKIYIFSRDEMKQWSMKEKFRKFNNVEFIIGDIRDKERLSLAFKGVDIVVHAAATKIVPFAEKNPFECIKTNILGSMNVLTECVNNKVKKIVALSTDKASSPINLYGASKLCSDKLFISGNFLNTNQLTKTSVVRYGNVMGSRGSVIPFFLKIPKNEKIPITHKDMTRFMISLKEGVELVWHAIEDMIGGEIYVKKIPSMKVTDIAQAINPNGKFKIIGIRAGEKIHEQMIGADDANYTYEFKDYYKILPFFKEFKLNKKYIKNGKKVKSNFIYSSDSNKNWMKVKHLKQWLISNKEKFLN